MLEGRVTVGTADGEKVEIGPGDLVTFAKGLQCYWIVHERIRKVYRFLARYFLRLNVFLPLFVIAANCAI